MEVLRDIKYIFTRHPLKPYGSLEHVEQIEHNEAFIYLFILEWQDVLLRTLYKLRLETQECR